MFSVSDLKGYHTGFEIGDLFGKGRMKELIYDYRNYKEKTDEELSQLRTIAMAQATIIPKMYHKIQNPEENLKDENAALQKELAKALQMQASLQEYAEDLERKIKELKGEN